MKGWWKMTISHLKHSYLNWKAIPCRKRNKLCLCNLLFQHFLNLAFLILVWTRSNFSSAWYDNQISFSCFFFLFFFFLVLKTCLLWAMTHTLNGFPGWSTISHARIILKGSFFFCLGLFIPFLLVKKWVMAQKGCPDRFYQQEKGLWLKRVVEEWAIVFLVNMS